MRAYRWPGDQRAKRVTLRVHVAGVPVHVEFDLVEVHIEPDQADRVVAGMDPTDQLVSELVLRELCRQINAR